MNESEKFCLSCLPRKEPIPDDGCPFCSGCVEAGWDTAFKRGVAAGRESVLLAAHELLGASPALLAQRAVEAASTQQSANTISALGYWCAMSPEVNYYSVEATKKSDPLKQWIAVMRHDRDPETDMCRTFIYGSTHADCLAKAAQFALLEIKRWSK